MSIRTGIVKTLALALCFAALSAAASVAGEDAPKPHMMYFYNPGCRLCTKTNEVVGAMEQKHGGVMSHQRFNIADPKDGLENVEYMFEMLDVMEQPPDITPTLVVFLGMLEMEDGMPIFTPARVLVDGDDIGDKLEKEIDDFLSKEGKGGKTLGMIHRPASFFSVTALASVPAPDPDGETGVPFEAETAPAASGEIAVDKTSRAASSLEFWAISGAALADSVNPCAFATIIILVAMMSSAKRTKREIVMVCLAFTVSVFLTYFAIGLFLHKLFSYLSTGTGWFLIAMDLVYYLAFALCVVFGLLSLRDFYMLYCGRAAEEMTLKLPKAFKKRINVAMAKGVRASFLVGGVFVAGVTVSFLEAACTGQVYLPTIISMAKLEMWQTVLLLAWYNLLFVLPLLIIFGLVLLGVTSQSLAEFFKKNVVWTKLALGLVFIVMGYVVWREMYWPPGYRGQTVQQTDGGSSTQRPPIRRPRVRKPTAENGNASETPSAAEPRGGLESDGGE